MVETRGALVTTEMIVSFKGLVVNIPKGFHLCDGTNGTLDLRDKFIKGAQSGDEGTTGGITTLTHSQPTQSAVKAGTSASTAAPLAHTHPDHVNVEPPYYKLAFIMKL